ncbi:hypothetical protein COLU111180_00705 [Cohnella lubricantis]|uniref:Uncharacterized protein n=1 Tax=Cohnella lubricantis TaxID=2163172 RepID=A0A841TEP7_9BACL|nr:hypothetical protein [Cohnella lubricantis]MBB6679744.1 hypothetical protein [Cohnella lubricantis]MBP2119464.1 magnesium-transporting ATPase (P-type) [Cohnella lubricantis]
MNRYLKLVHLEVQRFRYVLFGLMALTLIIQSIAIVWTSRNEMSRIREHEAIRAYYAEHPYSFAFAVSNAYFWLAVPILISVVVLALYVFGIWYRDWFGRDTFAYRLLTLPTARRNVYLAKATAILLFVFSMVAFQLLAMPFYQWLFRLAVPADLREPASLAEAVRGSPVFELLIPTDFTQFLIYYGFGIIAVFIVFTAILLERSYRWRGIFYAIVYIAACLAAFFLPLLLPVMDGNHYLYRTEILAIMIGIAILILAASIALGFRLIARKITV